MVVLASMYSCKKSSCSGCEKATLRDGTGIGGCGMVIELSNGKMIEPRNLDSFDITPLDGDKIWVKYHNVVGGGTVCMIGDVVEIDYIEKR